MIRVLEAVTAVNLVEEIIQMKHLLCHVLLLWVHPWALQILTPTAKEIMTIKADEGDKKIPAQEEKEAQEETQAQEVDLESEANKD